MERKRIEALWGSRNERHPWIKVLKATNPVVVRTLFKLAVDAYHDSKNLTLAAWSWPGRSLAAMHAEQQYNEYCHEETKTFTSFKPSPAEIHYRDPIHYAEMLDIIGKVEREYLAKDLKDCICLAIQMDGSVDSKQQDKKYIFVRFNLPKNPLCIETRFVAAREASDRGAKGLFGALLKALEDLGIEKGDLEDKLVGLTTDGESANTGRESGLWSRVEKYVGHPTINFWCACHRSDLAMEDIMKSVPELKIWQSNLVGLATYYRASGLRTKELKSAKPSMKVFPAHHEVRFSQHLVQLCDATLFNLDGCFEHWKKITDSSHSGSGEYERKEINSAKGFLKTWKLSGLQTWLTAFMVDICSIFWYIEKEAQKPDIIIPDIIRYRDIALRKLGLLAERPYPGNSCFIFCTLILYKNPYKVFRVLFKYSKTKFFLTVYLRLLSGLKQIENMFSDKNDVLQRNRKSFL